MTKTSQQTLADAISHALQKINSNQEKDICRFIPGPRGGYIHHFTFKKLKEKEPEQCLSLINKYILESAKPRELDPTPRAPRGLNRNNGQIKLPNEMVSKIIHIARESGDDSLLAKLLAARPLNQVKRDLIRSIRENKANQELWEAYKDAVLAASE